jgi:hypothetical protein
MGLIVRLVAIFAAMWLFFVFVNFLAGIELVGLLMAVILLVVVPVAGLIALRWWL